MKKEKFTKAEKYLVKAYVQLALERKLKVQDPYDEVLADEIEWIISKLTGKLELEHREQLAQYILKEIKSIPF